MAEILQLDFSGGIQSGGHPAKIPDNAYYFLQNARTREGGIEAIKKPKKITSGIPEEAKLQGIYCVGNYMVLFADGKALFKDLTQDDSIPFTTIPFFEMSSTVDFIYAQAVPYSSMDFLRKAGSSIDAPTTLISSNISGTPACVVCQDGINQPQLIFPNATSRAAQLYEEWGLDSREYIPVGKQMCVADVKLYVLSPDGKQIYQSVSGRYLDFVVNITSTGAKGGDATTTSHSVNFNQLNAITTVSGNDVSNFFVGSALSSHLVVPDINNTIFGEPKFRNIGVLPTGPLNQFSYVDILGDSVIIDSKGLRSVNATQQLLTESNNDIFSTPVFPFFTKVVQDITCVGAFDNYIHFAVKTVYGYGILIYDLSTKAFISFDQFEGVGAIKQFSEAKVGGVYKLYFITADNELYEAYASEETATAVLHGKELCKFKPKEQLQFKEGRVQFTNIISSGIINASAMVDRSEYSLGERSVIGEPKELGSPYPLNTGDGNVAAPFIFTNSPIPLGYSIGFRISWNFDGELQSISFEADVKAQQVSNYQKAIGYQGGSQPITY